MALVLNTSTDVKEYVINFTWAIQDWRIVHNLDHALIKNSNQALQHSLRFNTHMKLLNNFRQYMIFIDMLTSVFNVEASETKKLKNNTKFANRFELKAVVNQSLKESFPLELFCSLVLIYVGCNVQ